MFIELSEDGDKFLVNLNSVTSIAFNSSDGRAIILSVITDEQRKFIADQSYDEVKAMVIAAQKGANGT